MATLKMENVRGDLSGKGFTAKQLDDVEEVVKTHMPKEAINKAIIFLGWATVILTGGSILLSGLDKAVPDALWGALGAGIGGLAGVFMGNQ